MPNAMYSCPMTQPPTLSINLPLGNLTIPVRMSPSYVPPTIISPPVTCAVTSSSSSIVPPPPYHTINITSISYDADIDVVGITDVARDVHLDDDDDEEQYDKPLDLSLKKREVRCSPSCSAVPKPQPRPTVIRNGYDEIN
uniref:Ovule protein n=1 Tax=Elaeophora elaphi TaxID=1147741 RepID=A0A0R3S7G9_9BILA